MPETREWIELAHALNAGARVSAEPSSLHGASSTSGDAYEGCDVALSIEHQHRVWNPETEAWDPETSTLQLSADEAAELHRQLGAALEQLR